MFSTSAAVEPWRFCSAESADGRVLPRLQDQQLGGNQKTRTESERREPERSGGFFTLVKVLKASFVCQTADKLIRTFAEQIFYTGFIHADPHPGNGGSVVLISHWHSSARVHLTTRLPSFAFLPAVLVRRGCDNRAELVLLDHGLYEFLSHG